MQPPVGYNQYQPLLHTGKTSGSSSQGQGNYISKHLQSIPEPAALTQTHLALSSIPSGSSAYQVATTAFVTSTAEFDVPDILNFPLFLVTAYKLPPILTSALKPPYHPSSKFLMKILITSQLLTLQILSV